MAYIEDEDLEFLKDCSPMELEPIVDILLYDIKDGEPRRTEELSKSDGYKAYYEKRQHHKYWEDIAEELQCFGANSFATFFRGGKGVLYSKILRDVSDKFNIEYDKNDSTKRIESLLLRQLVSQAIQSIDMNKDMSLLDEFKGKGLNIPDNLNKTELHEYILEIVDTGNSDSYYFTECVVNHFFKEMKSKGVIKSIQNSILTGGAATTIASVAVRLAGQVTARAAGAALGAALFANDVASPAYRVTVPAVIKIALLRKKKNTKFNVVKRISQGVSNDVPMKNINYFVYAAIAIIAIAAVFLI